MSSNNSFTKSESYTPKNEKEKRLVKAFAKLNKETDVVNFLRDILTLAEIEEFSNRLEIARLLLENLSYQKIAKQVGVSTTTVTRVAHWLFRGCGGYQTILNIKNKSK